MNYTYSEIEDNLRIIFDNPSICTHIEGMRSISSALFSNEMAWRMTLLVKISSYDMMRANFAGKREWDEAIVSAILSGGGQFVNREVSQDIMSPSVCVRYDIRIADIETFMGRLADYARVTADDRFREAFKLEAN